MAGWLGHRRILCPYVSFVTEGKISGQRLRLHRVRADRRAPSTAKELSMSEYVPGRDRTSRTRPTSRAMLQAEREPSTSYELPDDEAAHFLDAGRRRRHAGRRGPGPSPTERVGTSTRMPRQGREGQVRRQDRRGRRRHAGRRRPPACAAGKPERVSRGATAGSWTARRFRSIRPWPGDAETAVALSRLAERLALRVPGRGGGSSSLPGWIESRATGLCEFDRARVASSLGRRARRGRSRRRRCVAASLARRDSANR